MELYGPPVSYFYQMGSKIKFLLVYAGQLEVIVVAEGKMRPKSTIDDARAKIKEIYKVRKDELKWKGIEETQDALCCLPFVHCPWVVASSINVMIYHLRDLRIGDFVQKVRRHTSSKH